MVSGLSCPLRFAAVVGQLLLGRDTVPFAVNTKSNAGNKHRGQFDARRNKKLRGTHIRNAHTHNREKNAGRQRTQ